MDMRYTRVNTMTRMEICDAKIMVTLKNMKGITCEGNFSGLQSDYPVLRLVDNPAVQIEYCWHNAENVASKGKVSL